jgi:acid phosphatase type 7
VVSIRLVIAATVLSSLTSCSHLPFPASSEEGLAESLSSLPVGPKDVILVGAGDIARCGLELPNARATGKIVSEVLHRYPQVYAFTAGDNAYDNGTAEEFRECYEKAWGDFKERTLPAPGNHDYRSTGAAPYFGYFHYYRSDPAARSRGYYGTDLGPVWHLASLNNYLNRKGVEAELEWLDEDLRKAEKEGRCTVAV